MFKIISIFSPQNLNLHHGLTHYLSPMDRVRHHRYLSHIDFISYALVSSDLLEWLVRLYACVHIHACAKILVHEFKKFLYIIANNKTRRAQRLFLTFFTDAELIIKICRAQRLFLTFF